MKWLRLITLVDLLMLLAACASNTPVPPVPNLPTPTVPRATPIAVSSATATLAPLISLTPATGGPNTQVTLTGQGFPPRLPVSLRIAPASGGNNTLVFGGVVADAQGRISVAIVMPDRWSNGVPITEKELLFLIADEGSSATVVASFTFQPSAAVTPTTRPAPTATARPSPTPLPIEQRIGYVSFRWLNVRSGPGTNYSLVARIEQDEDMILLGRTADGSWIQVQLPGGQEGWAPTSSIESEMSLSRLPVTGVFEASPAPEPIYQVSAYVSYRSTSLRSGPGSSFSLIARLDQGQDMLLLGRIADSTWVQAYLPGGQQGWVNATHVDADAPITSLPVTYGLVLTPTPGQPETEPTAYSMGGPLELRAGPGIDYQLIVVAALSRNQGMSLRGRNAAATWVQVRVPDGTVGWATVSAIRANVSITDLVVIAGPDPRITLSNLSVSSGSLVKVDVQGFLSYQDVIVAINSPSRPTNLVVGRGRTDAKGVAQFLFTMPGLWPDGTPITESDLVLVVKSVDGIVFKSADFHFIR